MCGEPPYINICRDFKLHITREGPVAQGGNSVISATEGRGLFTLQTPTPKFHFVKTTIENFDTMLQIVLGYNDRQCNEDKNIFK